ncbi:aspartate/glutamate racemase family protein [Aspergillus clavatus NRRL 1]|uniref:DCG1-like protein n=1 Tax=Aspergillus clavatus (strain ATCC 1007 / CBS 513.65 / DSM 816 / NCTC 3887 / NRRL 1 / QM 1276 / 107) TaxID=344612 RepID=A1CPC0_ASPCL|nr:uncharacterized protein ACLA_022050 [Aspergillus clavatus NRRL 1]EAW07491.1 conserved hypothetical protein [Aspergillus clavatus NRRL 1]
MAASRANRRFSVLIVNPNTSTHMTDALKPIVESLNYTDVQFHYFTAPTEPVTLPDGRVIDGVPSINSGEDSVTSALHCKPFVEPLLPKYDAFLIACYSAHPLVGMLKDAIAKLDQETKKYATGIFEASVLMSLSLTSSFNLSGGPGLEKEQAKDTFGIVTTGSIWKDELTKSVTELLVNSGDSHNSSTRFAGVETTGLTAVQLHTTAPEEVRKRISDATERLIKSTPHPLSAICMGCAGMAGMEEAVRDGCIRVYGERQGRRVRIVDGVVAGAGMLVTACKAGF